MNTRVESKISILIDTLIKIMTLMSLIYVTNFCYLLGPNLFGTYYRIPFIT